MSIYHYHLTPKIAKISKAQSFVGYAPTNDIYQGMEEAIEWYIESIGN